MDEMTNTQRLPSVAEITQPDVAKGQKSWAGVGGLTVNLTQSHTINPTDPKWSLLSHTVPGSHLPEICYL